MMRKQIVSLMLGAVFLTTSPLFAMEPKEETVTTIGVKQPTPGKGNLWVLDDNTVIEIVASTKSTKTLLDFSCTSKEMRQVCALPCAISYANTHCMPIEPLNTLTHRIFNLFSNLEEKYEVTTTWITKIAEKGRFCMGGREFKVRQSNVLNFLKYLPADEKITFEAPIIDTSNGERFPYFSAQTSVCMGTASRKDLEDPNYVEQVKLGNIIPTYVINTYKIKPIKNVLQ